MMEEPLSRGTSPSCDSNLSGGVELTPRAAISDRIIEITPKQLLSGSGGGGGGVVGVRTPSSKKAKRCRFFRNGDKFYTGVVMAVTPERYRSFDSLATDLTRALIPSVTLPNGVRVIYSIDGKKVQSINELEDGKSYVVSGQGELFKKIDYSSNKVKRGSSLSGLPQSPAGTGRQINSIPACVKAKIITLIRHGTKPRKVLRLLLNKRNAMSLEHVFEAITEIINLDCGAVKRVYTLSRKLVISLEQFFESEEIFLVYGSDKSMPDDFELDIEESKCVQSFKRGPWISKRQSGPIPVMPKKSATRALSAPCVQNPDSNNVILPQPLRIHYSVGHVIGVGYFAVVRHCVHKPTGAEYAIKIVDKYKCRGKEAMLASEVAILRQVCHPNIISLIDEQETTDQLFLVMELVKGGDLFDAITTVTKFPEIEASIMMRHLMSALAYLHSHHIVHRDVKPENLLVEMEGNHIRCLKLSDFGLAQVVRERLYTLCGTPTYVAPEILGERGYGLKVDVWAAGVILYISLCGFPPFVSQDNDQEILFERILNGKYKFRAPHWTPISDSAKQLISNMLQVQPELRFSAEDVLDHPWLMSFLGGEQSTSGVAAANELPQQHGNQYGQPMRVATFEFDYKKQRCSSGDIANYENEERSPIIETTPVRNRWHNAPFMNETFQKGVIIQQQDDDETDNFNGNGNDEEPISLSVDCLQDIRALTSSLHNLMNDMEDSNGRSEKTSKSVTSSINSIPDKIYSSTRNNNGHCQSPLSSKLHSRNKRNGNSLSDIHSITTPKSLKCNNINKTRPHSRNSYNDNINGTTTPPDSITKKNENIPCGTRNYSPMGRLSQFNDGLSCSSDNNVETSDSFVNIKFANVTRETGGSSSTQSIESSESFENIRFDQPGNKNVYQSHKVSHASGVSSHDTARRLLKSAPSSRMSHHYDSTVSKLPRASQIPVQINGQQANLGRTSDKTECAVKSLGNESVKLREKKLIAPTKREMKHDRFSCFPHYSTRKTQEINETDKTNRATMLSSNRKCSSTDELKDEQQQQKSNSKTHRYSLYYTPQLSRKTYECDNIGVGKNFKSTNARGSGRPTSWKIPDSTKPIAEVSGSSEKKINNANRRSKS
ncbi:hypothetical protein PV325_002224 [Microctonus aethiopoides]|nr:hypothetical protein PV325_002224 [Microctonus aethiopoides]